MTETNGLTRRECVVRELLATMSSRRQAGTVVQRQVVANWLRPASLGLARDALDPSHASECRLGESHVAKIRHPVLDAPLPHGTVAFDRTERFQETRVRAHTRAAHLETLGELFEPHEDSRRVAHGHGRPCDTRRDRRPWRADPP